MSLFITIKLLIVINNIMIIGLDHIAIIVSSENSINFYKNLGFIEKERLERGYDTVVYLKGYDTVLEIVIDPSHPKRVDKPEAMGLRHLAFKVDSVVDTIKHLNVEAEPIRVSHDGKCFTFFKDPDGLPIELHE